MTTDDTPSGALWFRVTERGPGEVAWRPAQSFWVMGGPGWSARLSTLLQARTLALVPGWQFRVYSAGGEMVWTARRRP